MSGPLTPATLALLLFCVLTDAGREICFKSASLRSEPGRYVVSLLTRPFLWLGVLVWAVEAVAWIVALGRAPLAVAFPVMALTYAVTPIAAGLLLRERLTRHQAAGAALVTFGALVVSLSELGPAR